MTTRMVSVSMVTDGARRAISVDLSAGHLAVSGTDASCHTVNPFNVPLVTCGKSRHQAEVLVGDAVAGVVAYAGSSGKPIILEKPDFGHKKACLEGESLRYSRMHLLLQLW